MYVLHVALVVRLRVPQSTAVVDRPNVELVKRTSLVGVNLERLEERSENELWALHWILPEFYRRANVHLRWTHRFTLISVRSAGDWRLSLTKAKTPQKTHEFTNVPEFDKAMRKLVQVDPEAVRKREEESRTPREKRKR